MGRHKKQIDDTVLLKMRGEGKNLKEISEEMKTSTRTLSRRIAYLQYQEGLLTKYRQLQGLQLTALRAKILSAIDDDNIKKASLVDIANALLVITKVELAMKEKESGKCTGLVNHIQALENDPKNK